MMPGDRKVRPTGWFLVFLALIIAGTFIEAPDHGDREPDPQCSSVEWRPDTDREAWELLIEQGYTTRGDTLVPPGCEGAR